MTTADDNYPFTGHVTDERLTRAEYQGRVGATEPYKKRYRAVYADGTAVVFLVNGSGQARLYAREWSVRMLGGVKVVSVRWDR